MKCIECGIEYEAGSGYRIGLCSGGCAGARDLREQQQKAIEAAKQERYERKAEKRRQKGEQQRAQAQQEAEDQYTDQTTASCPYCKEEFRSRAKECAEAISSLKGDLRPLLSFGSMKKVMLFFDRNRLGDIDTARERYESWNTSLQHELTSGSHPYCSPKCKNDAQQNSFEPNEDPLRDQVNRIDFDSQVDWSAQEKYLEISTKFHDQFVAAHAVYDAWRDGEMSKRKAAKFINGDGNHSIAKWLFFYAVLGNFIFARTVGLFLMQFEFIRQNLWHFAETDETIWTDSVLQLGSLAQIIPILILLCWAWIKSGEFDKLSSARIYSKCEQILQTQGFSALTVYRALFRKSDWSQNEGARRFEGALSQLESQYADAIRTELPSSPFTEVVDYLTEQREASSSDSRNKLPMLGNSRERSLIQERT